MRINTAWKKIVFFIFLGVLLAGCDFTYHGDKEEESGEDGNSSGGGSSSGTPALVEGEWTDGTISKDGQIDRYTISVSKGMRYFVYLNDTDDGDGTKTADMGLKIYHSDGTAISSNYSSVQSCWEKPFTFRATSDGTVTITAAAYYYGWEEGAGTYAIKYMSRPEYDTLSEGQWKDDKIIADGQTNKYSFFVDKGTRYFIYLNNAYEGDTTKTARVGLKISHSDGTTISSSYSNVDECWEKPFTFCATGSGTITIITAAHNGSYWEKGTGTYAIKYTSRSEYDMLSKDVWKDDDIIADGQTNKYSIAVADRTRYFIYLNDKSYGDGTKTAYRIGMKAYSGNEAICSSYTYNCWEKPFTFIASGDGTVTITAASYNGSYWGRDIGTYAIRYTTRPEYYVLSEGDWKDDSIITDGQTNKYSLKVTKGTEYSISLNDKSSGDGTKTAYRMGLKIIYTQTSNSDNPVVCDSYNTVRGSYVTPYTFIAQSNGEVIITAAAYNGSSWERGIGTYAIKYTSGS